MRDETAGRSAPMSSHDFRVFQDHQPDGQRWELVEGTPVMMTPPKITHQRVAQNLARLLDDAVDALGLPMFAIQTPGVELGLGSIVMSSSGRASTYVPEPDVALIMDLRDPDRRIVDAAVVLVEIVSSTDEIVTSDGRPWVDVKAALYRMHGPCQAVLVIEQERVQIRLWVRSGEDWHESRLSDLSERLHIPCCGLSCDVGEIYAKTHLAEPEIPPRGI